MPSDIRAQQAREAHRAASLADADAVQHRKTRDRLIKALRAEDPRVWTYEALAGAVGCSPELVAAIIKNRTRRR
jgi:AraC-like DNA-binding protein